MVVPEEDVLKTGKLSSILPSSDHYIDRTRIDDETRRIISSLCGSSPYFLKVRLFFALIVVVVIAVFFDGAEASERSRDFYRVLGVPRTATTKQIKKVWIGSH